VAALEHEQLLERFPVERLEQLDAHFLLDVVVLPAVGDQRRHRKAPGVLAAVALEPERVVVGRGVIALLRVLRGVAGPDAVERRVDRGGIGRRGAAETEVEGQRRVEVAPLWPATPPR